MRGAGRSRSEIFECSIISCVQLAEPVPSREIMRVRTGICWSGLRLKASLALGEAADRGETWHQPGPDFYGFDPTGFD